MSHLLVIGGTSLDVLHLKGQTVHSAGGAGMYTAMAAKRCGVEVSLFAPRPEPIPDAMQPVANRLTRWLGPSVPPEELPHFEIAYEQGETRYLKAYFGSEALLTPASLPADLSTYDLVHLVPLGDAHRQLAFIRACQERGAGRISAGTYLTGVVNTPGTVREIIAQTDIFFMNAGEAQALFGSLEAARTHPGKLLFITLGARGARIIQGEYASEIPTLAANELDPTGAGDTFCGATLAGLIHHHHPVLAARRAAPLAARMIEQVGPAALLSSEELPDAFLDRKVAINPPQVERIARLIANIGEAAPFQFVGPELPLAGHPGAVEYFFAATLQQFGFWTGLEDRYHRPLIAEIGGKKLKGAFYLFEAYRRRLEQDPDFCSPQRQAALTRDELLAVFRADDGSDPMPALDLHLQQARYSCLPLFQSSSLSRFITTRIRFWRLLKPRLMT